MMRFHRIALAARVTGPPPAAFLPNDASALEAPFS
jgi:hypothetical protein